MKATNLLKAKLKRKDVGYAQFVDKLAEIGIDEKEADVRNELPREKFTAGYLLQCLSAIGATTLQF